MPWIWSMTWRGKLWLSRRARWRRSGSMADSMSDSISVVVRLDRVEVVELARRPDARDILGRDVAEARELHELAHSGHVLSGELLDPRVAPQALDPAGDVHDRFVQRVPEGLAGVAADQEHA